MSLSQLFLLLLALLSLATAQQNDDASVMLKLRDSLNNPSSLSWTGSDPCNGWAHVQCSSDNRVTRIQIGSQKLTGTLPPQLSNLTQLTVLEVMNNQLTGSVPSLSGLNKLQTLLLHDNSFTSFRSDFFRGLSSLITVSFDNNPFQRWEIPASLADATSLKSFSATNASINGKIPSFLNNDVFPELNSLRLSYNYLEGEIPANFSGSMIQFLWLNGQNGESKLNGSVGFLGGMSNLLEVWLQGNAFTGPLPDLSGLSALRYFSVRDNQLTGIVPDSLVNLASLSVVNLTNNLFQGRMPAFPSGVVVDVWGINSFCLNTPGTKCDARVDLLLSVAKEWNYPASLAQSWKGNDPCVDWDGISCSKNDIIVVNLQKRGLAGNISSNFSLITPLQRLILSNNLLSGTIPSALTTLPSLTLLDVSNNLLFGTVPNFRQNVQVITKGNVDIGKNSSSAPPGTTPAGSGGGGGGGSDVGNAKKSATGKIVGGIAAGVVGLGVVFALVFFLSKNKKRRSSKVQSPNTVVIHPRHSGDHDEVKITVAESSASRGAGSYTDSGPSDIHVEAGNMVISIQVLKNVTNNFSEQNILGKGGFGTVYKGELHDGTKIAVKRMESSVVSEKGLTEFMSEIKVLNKVRHRHLVALLGYCLEGAEKLLVYEYMPQGTLGRYLFNWKEEGLEPLDWKRRLTIALDVARGVEYLHSLAQQSFIHRDLKPSNILLGDDMRAKVSDFGLVRLAPEGKASFETRLAGTFGYLAPEYAVTGRVTTKVDVFSFGVILMEMITGRRALDENQPEDSMHLVSWFRRMTINKDSFNKAIDPTLELDEETLVSIKKVAELAGHCTAREPYQRPDMGHVVNVLSSLAELWKPSEPDSDDIYGIDLDMTLPQALKKWQAFEGSNLDDSSSSSYFGSGDNTQTSIPTRPSGFAESFTSADGR